MKPQILIHRVAMIAALAAAPVLARPARERHAVEPVAIHSGYHDGDGGESYVAYRELIQFPDAPWLRVRFGAHELGQSSFVTLTSAATGETQPLDRAGMEVWRNTSVQIRGDLIELQLHVAPSDTDVFVTVESVTMPDFSPWADSADGGTASICGDFDNRVSSNDSRVGRLDGCTAWLVSTGVVLTAGHCRDDDTGDLEGNLQFNVPPSDPNGNSNPAAMSDTYPIINNSWTWQEGGVGDDWLVFRIGAAADGSGKRAHAAQGFFHMTAFVPPEDATMRVTGYGLDNIPVGTGGSGADCCDADNDDDCNNNCNSSSRTQQTATGRFDQLSDDVLEYEVDTMPANSGSPVIRESTGLAVGIHTAGGCGYVFEGDENHGTWFGDGPLSNALNNYLGGNTAFVDSVNVTTIEAGTAILPFESVGAAVNAAPSGWTLLIAAGSYPASGGNTFTTSKTLTLTSNTGVVTIGN